jgi:hypothetical protein
MPVHRAGREIEGSGNLRDGHGHAFYEQPLGSRNRIEKARHRVFSVLVAHPRAKACRPMVRWHGLPIESPFTKLLAEVSEVP